MKELFLATLFVACLAGQQASADPVKTKTWDVLGTTFIVTVDWDTSVVVADLRRNPAGLSGERLEQSMQNAVYYSSAAGCRMNESGRVLTMKSKAVGVLVCPWFK